MRIKFNNEDCETKARSTVEFLSSKSSDESDVWIVNGFCTKEDLELKEGDELFCIARGKMPPQEALEAMMSSRHTPKVHSRLKKGFVAVCGLGGLGSNIAVMLARIGVGKLLLIDFDLVEPSNLNRQSYFVEDLAKPKTQALSEQITKINPFITVLTQNVKITPDNIASLFKDCDIVCEAFDSAAAKAMLAQNFHTHFPKTTLICASGLAGYGNSNAIETRKIGEYFYVCGDLVSAAKVGNGLMAPRVMLCAAHQANLTLELLVKLKA
ncbi:sulfur carrier protein ThiS adenylyltransferase ThiF [Campylobacter troglodytis]|uniref:sulfur carrier protein ThiS adenylyltransferase ThiF n=1 Tax=Campylobacter troglodytis TaxID=654363 RepID=UPI0011586435|nr:sulfur carrier protein ThiS adenylyltransferase ThiF [Campylobacter troglodytis]TQR56924.1 sulfur carrier protein ThiS adenylyltransferase ThiF [Campylobacter troglodytis]